MIVRDTATGALHEVPESQLYEVGEMQYDGLGNAVGFNPFSTIGNLVSAPFQAIRQVAAPIVRAVGGMFQPGAQAAGNVAASFVNPIAQAMQPALPGMPPPMPPMPVPPPGMPWAGAPGYPPPYPGMMPRPAPPGWLRSGMYPVAGPNRLYLRCSAWPGPAGLTPGPGLLPAGMPGAMPGIPGVPGAAAPVVRRRYRRRRR